MSDKVRRLRIRVLSRDEHIAEMEDLKKRVPEEWHDLLDDAPEPHRKRSTTDEDDEFDYLEDFIR